MSFIIVDLEATCWESGRNRDRMEIIEIGAVRMEGADQPAADEFASFVRPIEDPTLSEFCRQLTSIRQEDVDAADPFPDVFESFLEWIGPGSVRLCSWGGYDLGQFRRDCQRHRLRWPVALNDHVNLKLAFAEQHGSKPCGMRRALRRMQLPLEGTHHRGIDDARNIAKLARTILPWVVSREAAPR